MSKLTAEQGRIIVPNPDIFNGRIPPNLNPFQMKLFLNLHEQFDHFVSDNRIRQLTRANHEIDLQELQKPLQNSIRNSNSYSVSRFVAPFLALSIVGVEECEETSKATIRGLLDIDKAQFDLLYAYFADYYHNLDLTDRQKVWRSDPQFVSNRFTFRRMVSDLSGSHLLAIGFPDALSYTDQKSHEFDRGVKERIEKVIREGPDGHNEF